MSKVTVIRYASAALLLLVGLGSFTCLLGNIWAASFRDRYYEMYVQHSYICMAGAALAFGGCIAVLLCGRYKRIGNVLRTSFRHR